MSMTACQECNQQHSASAHTCPHCGHPYQSPKIVVTDFDIGFGNLVGLLVKIVLASIPAIIILVAIAAVIAGLIGSKH